MVKQYYKTIQKRAYTTKDAYEEFRWLLRDCNDLRASAIIQRRDEWRGRRNKINLNHQSKEVTALRKEEERWNRISHLIPRGVVRTVDKAFKNFFKSGFGYPRIEHKTKTIEINEKNAVLKTLVKYHQNKVIVRIKGLKSIHVPIKEPMPDIEELRKFSISLKAGKLYVNFVFKDYPEELPKTGKSVGIDLGVRERLVVSDGTRYPARERNTRIDNLNRKLSRKKKGSRSWHKTRAELSREYHRDAVKNRNDCHQIAHELVKENDRITFEDLPIKNMTKSAKGTKNKPGKNVAQKRGLNRSIKTQTWGLIRSLTLHKAERAGKTVNFADPKYTSQLCHKCGEKGWRKDKIFLCYHCDDRMDADDNASKNVEIRGGNTALSRASPGLIKQKHPEQLLNYFG